MIDDANTGQAAKFSASGTVYREQTGARVTDAVVWAYSASHPARVVFTNVDGNYELGDLDQGEWTLTALQKESRALALQPFQLNENEAKLDFKLQRLEDTVDAKSGTFFFAGICLSLLGLIVVYIILHMVFPPSREPLSPSLSTLVTTAQDQAKSASKPSESVELATTLSEIGETLTTVLSGTTNLKDTEKQIFKDAVTKVQEVVKANNTSETVVRLGLLHTLLENPPTQSFFWDREPWRFLEVLLWGLAGILANLIMTVGSYLRWDRFYREGLYLHIAQIITVPILALVTVLLISMVTLTLTLSGGTQVQLDLRDPRLLAAVSFLVGVGPWAVWKFVRETSSHLTGKVETAATGK